MGFELIMAPDKAVIYADWTWVLSGKRRAYCELGFLEDPFGTDLNEPDARENYKLCKETALRLGMQRTLSILRATEDLANGASRVWIDDWLCVTRGPTTLGIENDSDLTIVEVGYMAHSANCVEPSFVRRLNLNDFGCHSVYGKAIIVAHALRCVALQATRNRLREAFVTKTSGYSSTYIREATRFFRNVSLWEPSVLPELPGTALKSLPTDNPSVLGLHLRR